MGACRDHVSLLTHLLLFFGNLPTTYTSAMAGTQAPEYLASALVLIKALKAPSDPPRAEWPSKLDIAQEAINSSGHYLPNKAEIIRDWIFEVWAKAKPT